MVQSTSPFDKLPRRPEPARITSFEQIPQSPDALKWLGASVVDLIPKKERRKYSFLRGASLGAAAYNIVEHGMLNTARDIQQPHMHFADGPQAYVYADRVARSIAYGEGFNNIQFPASMQAELGRIAGTDLSGNTPGIIFALDHDYNEYILGSSTRGAQEGVVWDGAVTLDMIDKYSREALEAITDGLYK